MKKGTMYTYGQGERVFKTKKEAIADREEHNWFWYVNDEEMDKIIPIRKVVFDN